MDLNSVAAVTAAVTSIVAAFLAYLALKPAKRAAKAAEEQTKIQLDNMREAAQPHVWADIQPDNQQGTLIQLVVGNSGPTTATNIRVEIEPELPGDPEGNSKDDIAQSRLREGLLSLAPGRTIRWSLGKAFVLFEDENDTTIYRIRVTADGLYGPLEPIETMVRPSEWRESLNNPDGSLHFVRREIEKLTREIKNLR